MNKNLVAFFSASGTTRKIAETIASAANADVYEIVPLKPYTREDLNWMNPESRSSVEMRQKSFRPEILDRPLETASYDVIFLGFPIWWYVAPTIINTFLESYDFSGKRVILFATSGGSGFGRTVQELQPSAPNAVLTEGKIMNCLSISEIEKWAELYK